MIEEGNDSEVHEAREPPASSPGKRWLRGVITGLLGLHFGLVFLCNMPMTALTVHLDDYYSWYLKGTGQWQDGWRMFERPSALNDYYELEIRDGHGVRMERVRGMRELNVIINAGAHSPELQDEVLENYLWRKREELSRDSLAVVKLHRYTSTIQLEERVPRYFQRVQTWVMREPDLSE